MIDCDEITHKTALEVFRVAFNRRVGVGKDKMSYGDLSDTTGIRVRTLKSWHDGAAMPQLDSCLKLCAVFGPEFTSEILRVIGQGGVDSIEAGKMLNLNGTLADIVDAAHNITDRLRDGVFDRRDKALTGPELMKLSRQLEEQANIMLNSGLQH